MQLSAGKGIAINGTTISSDAVTTITAGQGISVSGNEITNDGVLSLTSASTNLVVTHDTSGNYVIKDANGGAGGVIGLDSPDNSITITNDGAGSYHLVVNQSALPGGVSGTGTAGQLAVFSGASSLTSANLMQGTGVSITTGRDRSHWD